MYKFVYAKLLCIIPLTCITNTCFLFNKIGQLLRHHGIEFDIVYTSWLTRAIETSWHILEEMDALWLPIVKTWRLNERMYGALTGLSKKMVSA